MKFADFHTGQRLTTGPHAVTEVEIVGERQRLLKQAGRLTRGSEGRRRAAASPGVDGLRKAM